MMVWGELIVLGLILYWLRATIDQQKGAWVEFLGVTLPLGIITLVAVSVAPSQSSAELGFRITPYVVFVFLSLLAVAGTRFTERMWRGEQPQITDMFRLTTITGLAVFVVRRLEIDVHAIFFVSVMAIAYLLSDLVVTNYNVRRSVTWLMAINLGLIGIILWIRNRFSTTGVTPLPLVMDIRPELVLGLLLAPPLLHGIVGRLSWMIPLGYWSEVVRYRFIRPTDSIYYRTLFELWRFRRGVCYLNHGSFGAVPRRIERAQREIRAAFAAEPMDMLARKLEPQWQQARDALAYWLGAKPECVALCENATAAMNELASWFPLQAGDEVLLTDHEYGAVKRIWARAADRHGAYLRTAQLPMPFDDPEKIVAAIVGACGERTRLVVFSHITSPTAVILPVARLCEELRHRNIASCVDGPHALLQERVQLTRMNCDFYTASCHKWLCAPLGSGALYVHTRWHERVEPLRLSWGLLPPREPAHWTDELTWVGTRDYSAYLSLSSAIHYFNAFEYERMDERNHHLACYARRTLSDCLGTTSVTPEAREWMGWMAAVWLPSGESGGDHSGLQQRLWERYQIEVPIVKFNGRYLVRVSCHLYNSTQDIDRLVRALSNELRP